jgi:hypothetical protein
MKATFTSDGMEKIVVRMDDVSQVTNGIGYAWPGEATCEVMNTGNGYIAYFPATSSTTQDYYVCLDYAQAHDLVLGLSMFKKELGFKDE